MSTNELFSHAAALLSVRAFSVKGLLRPLSGCASVVDGNAEAAGAWLDK